MKDLDLKCDILKGNFFLDSFNYFPITEELNTFSDIFLWGDKLQYDKLFNNNFLEEFNKNKNNFKSLSKIYVLGSSPGNNYYRNLITFVFVFWRTANLPGPFVFEFRLFVRPGQNDNSTSC